MAKVEHHDRHDHGSLNPVAQQREENHRRNQQDNDDEIRQLIP